jgi:hypothetical protein
VVRTGTLAAAALTTGLLAACGSSPKPAAQAAAGTAARTATTPATAKPRRKLTAAQRARVKKAKTYEKAFDSFSYHDGPLRVAQTVQFEDRPDYVLVRVPVKNFFCKLTPAEREAAIKVYYDLAAPQVNAAGQRPYRMDVGESSSSVDIKHLYARVRNGEVTLTREGSARRRC